MSRLLSRGALGAASLALPLLAALSLAACTGDPGPIITETPSSTAAASPSASPSVSPSAAPLTDEELLALMPPDAAFPDVRGAIATARFFLEQYPIAYETGDLRVWDALSMPECIFCESVRSHVSNETARGEFETGGQSTINEASIVANYYDVDGFTYVTFDYSQEPSILHHSDGSTEPVSAAESGSISLRMSLSGAVWRVSDVGVEST